MFCLPVCLCTTFVPGNSEARREHRIPIGLELKIVVIHHVGASGGAHHSPLKEQLMFLTAQSSLQFQPFSDEVKSIVGEVQQH